VKKRANDVGVGGEVGFAPLVEFAEGVRRIMECRGGAPAMAGRP
jgi:hypothetical protein